jgi:splicing factor U2AF subunit|tara:strand:+ start:335 stop:496 length:162 start_codon:yes stop_codon:yes gene_type:complete
VYVEFSKYGEILDTLVADNIGDHMMGNLYLKFATEEQAEACFKATQNTYHDMR